MKITEDINKRYKSKYKIFKSNKDFLTHNEVIICYLESILQKLEQRRKR